MEQTQKQPLYELLHHPHIWRACEQNNRTKTISTGHAQLDECLPGGGWPADSLSEVLLDRRGQGELRLLLPLLVQLSQRDDDRCLVWVAPPWVPYAPALAAAGLNLTRLLIVHADIDEEVMWATEQSLRSGSCAAVLSWSSHATVAVLRRLQLAASEGGTLGILFRPPDASKMASPAALRLLLGQTPTGLAIKILKTRGGKPATIHLPLGSAHTREISRKGSCRRGGFR
ncbi:MAG: translesion DNA synthesis-associated protein ImuA [Gammaproteobacteria bacterium]|nr:translesion DNA synthesis-associated protein ImuA [Gammaproteobacteria bacterium]